jgi:hypothetical protein
MERSVSAEAALALAADDTEERYASRRSAGVA